MQENVKSLTETVGTVRSAVVGMNGQANTRQYDDAEKTILVNAPRGERTFAQKWEDQPDRSVLGVDENA